MTHLIKAAVILLAVSLASSCVVQTDKPVCRVESKDKSVALTFDDGPHPKYTEEILDVLDEYGVKATFFVIGKNVKENPGLVEEELRRGHEVECHTYSHKYANDLGYKEALRELKKSEDESGVVFSYVRPPGGILSKGFSKAASELSYKTVLWSVDTRDWKCPGVGRVVSAVTSNVEPGDIILMHDYVSGKSDTPEALKIIIPKLLEEGYVFVTVDELINGK